MREASPPCVDADGFTEVRGKRSCRRRRQHRTRKNLLTQPAAPRIPAAFAERCLNCLSYKHKVATCSRPMRCFHCLGFWHLARDCKRPLSPVSSSSPAHAGQQHWVRRRGNSPPTPTGRRAVGRTPSPVRSRSPPTPSGSDAYSPTPSPPPHRSGVQHGRGLSSTRRSTGRTSPPTRRAAGGGHVPSSGAG
jgi:hypothetical protein